MSGAQIRSVRVLLSASTAGYIAEMKRAAAATDGVAASMTASGARASAAQKTWALAAKATKVAAIGVAGGLVVAGKAAADFSAEMALVKTLSHANQSEMRRLSDQALHMGQSWGYSATQVASGQEELIKAGVSLKDILGGGLKGTLALAAAGQTDVATATETAAAAMTQFKLKGKDVPHIADLLAAGADKALGSVTDLGDGLSQVGTTAHQMGFSIEETVGTLAEFAQAGLQGQRGGTVLNQMLLQLAAPTKQAKQLMDQYGLSLYDSNGQIKTMSQLAGNLQRSFSGLTPAQRNYAMGVIFGSRAIRGANILLKDGARANADWTRKVNDAGFAAHQASGKLDSLKGDWLKLKSATQTALISLGSGEQNPLRGLVQGVTSDIKKLERDGSLKRWGHEIGDTISTLITQAKPLASQVGHALAAVGRGVQTVVDGFNKLPDGVQKAIVTGGVVAYGAKKLGITSLLGAASGRAGGVGLAGRVGVVPVFVTNWGGKPGVPGEPMPGGPHGPNGEPVPGGPRGPRTSGAPESGVRDLLSRGGAMGMVRDLAVGSLTLAAAGNEVRGHALPMSGYYKAVAAEAQQAAVALGKLGVSQQIVTKAAKGDALAQVEVSTAMQKTRTRIDDLKSAQQRAFVAGDQAKYDRLGKQIDALSTAYDRAKGAIQRAGQAHADETTATETANRASAKYRQELESLPPKVQTEVKTPGAIQSMADVRRLQQQYGLTKKQLLTVVKLSGVDAAAAQARAYAQMLANLNGQVATTYLRQVVQRQGTSGAIAGGGHPILTKGSGSADGSTVPSDGGPYSDRFPYLLAPREEVTSNRHHQADNARRTLKLINRGLITDRMLGLANGGTVGLASGGTARFNTGTAIVRVPIARAANGWVLDARNVAVARAMAAAAHDVTNAYYDELKAARATKVSRVDELHTMQSIRDTQRELNARIKKGKNKGHLSLTGLDRRTAQAELADYKKQLADIRDARRDAIEQAKDDIRNAAIEQQRQNRSDTMAAFTGGLDLLSQTTSASRAVSLVQQQVTDIAQYGQVVARLRSKGASPMLLQQMQNHATQGDFRSAIRLGQALLAQPALLRQLNNAYTHLGQVSGSVATLTTDPRFLSTGKWDPRAATPKVVQVNLTADPTTWTREMQRIIKHEVQQQLARAV